MSGLLFHFYLNFDRNSIDPDAASDLGLHWLPMSQIRHARLIWVNIADTTVHSLSVHIIIHSIDMISDFPKGPLEI